MLSYNAYTKVYDSGMMVTCVCNRTIKSGYEVGEKDLYNFVKTNTPVRKKSDVQVSRVRSDSIKRSRDKIFDLCNCNKFTHFVTLTYDEKMIHRLDNEKTKKAFLTWANNFVKNNGLKYVAVPELHKKGGVHFHLLCSFDSVNLVKTDKKTKSGKDIYNLKNWKYGFTTAIEIDDNYQRTINYMLKYINK